METHTHTHTAYSFTSSYILTYGGEGHEIVSTAFLLGVMVRIPPFFLSFFLSFFLITNSFQCKCVFVLYLLRIYLHARRGQQNLGETTMQLLRINEKTTKKEILIT